MYRCPALDQPDRHAIPAQWHEPSRQFQRKDYLAMSHPCSDLPSGGSEALIVGILGSAKVAGSCGFIATADFTRLIPSSTSFITTGWPSTCFIRQLQCRYVTVPAVRSRRLHTGHSHTRRRSYLRRSLGPFILRISDFRLRIRAEGAHKKAEREVYCTPHSAIRIPQLPYGSSSTFQYASLMNFAQLATGA